MIAPRLSLKPPSSTLKAAKKKPKKPKSPDAARETILRAASDEFAQYGLSGARVDRIAQKMKLTKRMIYYYFHSKNALYEAVLARIYRDIREQDAKSDLDDIDPIAAIRRMIFATMDYEEAHPEFLRLVAYENFLEGKFLKDIPGIKDSSRKVLDRLANILERGKAQGKFRAEVNALDAHFVISSLCVFRVANRYTFEALHGTDLGSPAMRDHVGEVICDTVLKFLAA